MSEFHVGVNEEDNHSSSREKTPEPPKEPVNRLADIASNLLDHSDSIVYAVVGISFLLGALFALVFSFWNLVTSLITRQVPAETPFIATAIVQFVSDLLLVLIIMEVLSTVIHYLKEHATSLRPFLFIGIVSATRGVLSIGARLSVEQLKASEFNNSMIELGVNAAVILALGITLKLLGKLMKDS